MNNSDIISKLKKSVASKYGADALHTPDELDGVLDSQVKLWIKTGIPGLDGVLGSEEKGIPSGKLIEIYGPEGQGKSSLLYYLLGLVQKQGGIAGLIDSELSYDPARGALFGIDNSQLLLINIDDEVGCLEEVFDRIEYISKEIRSKSDDVFLLWGLDTVYATPTLDAMKASSYKDAVRIAALARALSQSLPRFCQFIAKQKVGMVFINQVRENIGVMFGDQYKTPGGMALKHHTSIRAIVKRKRKHQSGNIDSTVTNVKNKLANPFGSVEFKIDQKKGILEIKKAKK